MKTGTHDIHGIPHIVVMTEEEEKIRKELETEIEKDIEQEIIDGIRQLALRLHKLYQCRRRRTHPSSLAGCISLESELNDSLVTKVNITIAREEEFKLAAYESNSKGLNAARRCSPRSDTARRRLEHRIERLHCSKMSGLKSGSFMGTVRRCQLLSPVLKNKKYSDAALATAKPERKG